MSACWEQGIVGMGHQDWGYVARPPRYDTADDQSLQVAIQRAVGETPERIEARLLNLSRDGFQVRTSVPLAAKEAIVLKFEEPESGLEFDLPGTVCWEQVQGDGSWVQGCQSARQLDWEVLGELFLNELLATDS